MSLRHHAALRISFLSIAAVTGAGGAGHTDVPRRCRSRRVDKGHHLQINEKKKQQADRKRKYDSLRIYLGNTSDEWWIKSALRRTSGMIREAQWSSG